MIRLPSPLVAVRLLTGTAAIGLLTAPAAAVALVSGELNIDDDVAVLMQTADEPLSSGPLEAEPLTYTAVSRSACEAPYDDGARLVLLQDEQPERVVLSGVDGLEADGTARVDVDAVMSDIAVPGQAQLVIECVRVSAGIPEPAPESITQDVTVTETEWTMEGITEVPEEPAPSPSEPAPSPADPAAPEQSTDPQEPADPAEPGDDEQPANGEQPAQPSDPNATPEKPAPSATPREQSSASSTQPDPAGSDRKGPLARTGAEIGIPIAAAAALLGAGALLIRFRRR